MDEQNIDRLFREKLGGLEVAPSTPSWNLVEKQISGRKNKPYYWAAAVVLLVAVFSLLPDSENIADTIASHEINHPVEAIQKEMGMPVATSLQNKVSKPRIEITKKEHLTQDLEPVDNGKSADPRPAETISGKIQEALASEAVSPSSTLALEQPITPVLSDKKELPPIKITYIASQKRSFKGDSKKIDTPSNLQKLIAFTEKIDPAEMLANMKSAKDQLINEGFKNKKGKKQGDS